MPHTRRRSVSAVVPVRDQAATIAEDVESLLALPDVLEVVVVDDASGDDTAVLVSKLAAQHPAVRLVHLPRRLGPGAALRRGLAEASGAYVLVAAALEVPGDGYRPDPAAWAAELLADLVTALEGAPHAAAAVQRTSPVVAARGDRLLARLAGLPAEVPASAHRPLLARRQVLADLGLEEDGPEVAVELVAQLARRGYLVVEVGPRPSGSGAPPRRRRRAAGAREAVTLVKLGRRPPARPARVRVPDDFDEADEELASVLAALEGADNYTDWVTGLFVPYLGDRVLEVGAGHGTLVSRLARHADVTATDASPRCVEELRRRFAGCERVAVAALDLLAAEPASAYDSVVLANVLEHLPDDVLALTRVREHLVPGGSALVFVPALDALYSGFDRSIGHHRRYDRRQLADVARRAGLVVGELRYVNPVGAAGWLLAVRGLGRFPSARAVGAFDRLAVPRLAALERRWRPPLGQSLFLAAQRPSRPDTSS